MSEINNHNFYTSTIINYHQETTPNIISQNFYQCRKTHCPTAAQTETRYRQIRQMHTALHFQQEGQIIIQKRNTRCPCLPSVIIVQARPGKNFKINSNRKNALLRPPGTQLDQKTRTKIMSKKDIFRNQSKSMRNSSITTSATSCKPKGISHFFIISMSL